MPVTPEGAGAIPPIEIEQELLRLNDAWVDAFLRRDTDTLDRIMASDFVFIYPLNGIDNAKWRYRGHDILGYYRIVNVYSKRQGAWRLVTIQACPISLNH